ncbi:MAG: helix-turn-helix domain-containing protein [Planctomycetota bacterium]
MTTGVSITKQVLTTGEVAKVCSVAARTVAKWIDSGRLKGYRIPGSRARRVRRDELERFMAANGMISQGSAHQKRRVLVVDGGLEPERISALAETEGCEVHVAANGFEAGFVAQEFRPHVVVLGSGHDAQALAVATRSIRAASDAPDLRVFAIRKDSPRPHTTDDKAAGLDGWLTYPLSPAELARAA